MELLYFSTWATFFLIYIPHWTRILCMHRSGNGTPSSDIFVSSSLFVTLEDNTKKGYNDGRKRIPLVQNSVYWRNSVNTLMKLRLSLNSG